MDVPATALRANAPLGSRGRLGVGLLALVLLTSLGAATASPTEARNWTQDIAATRASQLYYERLMRAADLEIRSLARAHKQPRRSLAKARRAFRTAIDRRAKTRRDLEATRTRLRLARLALTAPAFEPPPPPDAAAAVLTLTEVGGSDADVPEASETGIIPIAVEPARVVVLAAAPVRSLTSAPRTPGASESPTLKGDIAVADVVALEREARKSQRAFQRAKQRAQRVSRTIRVKRHSLAVVKARKRSATARREGAEAALGGRILSMSMLAQRRVAKKTKVRPGVTSGFSWPARGRISQTYGCTGFRLNPPRGSCRHFHDGLDIAGYRGTPIRAAAVGVVSYIGWNPWDQNGRAFMVVVAHPGGYETLYGHVLPTRRVRVGQMVQRGEVIGYMGNTGRSTGVHLHFELRRGRTTLNPLAFL